MADVWSRLGIKPYEADPSKVKLTLEEAPKAQAKPRTPATLTPGTIFSEDGFIPDVLRTAGDTGLNYMNLGAAALNALGADIDRNKINDAINAVRGEQEKSEARTDSPMRAAEKAKIKAQMESAKGVVDNVMAGGEAGLDMLLHPIENSGKIVGGVLDPLNAVSFGAGGIAAKTAAKLGGAKLARIGGAATAGAVTNAPVNAIQEGSFAAARGEDWEKASQGAFGGGAVAGAIMGGVPGVFSKPHAAVIDPNAPIKEAMDNGIDMNGNPREARMGADGTYRPFDYPANPDEIIPGGGGAAFDIGYKRNPNMISDKGIDYTDAESTAQGILDYTQRKEIAHQNGDIKLIEHSDTIIQGLRGWHEPLGNRIQAEIDADTGNKIHDKINGIIDTEVVNRAADHVTQWADGRELIVRDEAAQAQAQIAQMLGNGMDRQTITATLDNMITPSREDMTITGLLNNNAPLPSRLSGVRPILMLENSIKTAIENPTIARTNKEFYEVLVAQGVDKPYANIMTSAYATKDPSILRDHIYQTLRTNTPALVDHEAIKTQVAAKVDGMMYAKEAIEIENAAKQESNAKIDALMSQLEFHPSKEKDNSIFFNYDGHEYFVNAHGAMGKVGIGEDGRRRYFAEDFDQRIGLTYGERTKLAERVYALKGKEVDNTAIITQADRAVNSQRVFVDYLTKGQSFKGENIDLPKAFQDFWKPTKPQSIDEFKKYVSRNKEKYIESIDKDIQKIDSNTETYKGFTIERGMPLTKSANSVSLKDEVTGVFSNLFTNIEDAHVDLLRKIESYKKAESEDAADAAAIAQGKKDLIKNGIVNDDMIEALYLRGKNPYDNFAKKIEDAFGIPKRKTRAAVKDLIVKDGDREYISPSKGIAALRDLISKDSENISNDIQTISKPIKKLSSQAQAIKDASEIPVGGSEDATKAAVAAAFQKQPDSQYKNLSAKDRAEMEQAYANVPEDLYGKAQATTNEIFGNDAGSANMALNDARAKAMGITPDEFYQRYGIEIENKTDQDGAQYVKDLEEGEAAFQLSEDEINGMVEMGFKSTGEMKSAKITIFKSADVTTLPHEFFHVYERTFSPEEKAAFDYAYREYPTKQEIDVMVEEGKITPDEAKKIESRSEAGARGWETYLGEGKAPTKELQGVFDKFSKWFRDLWEMVFLAPNNGFKINDSQRALYRAIMGDKEAIKEVFGDIDAAPIEKDMIAAKILDEMPEAATVTKGENTQGGLFGADDGIIQQPKLFSDKVEVDTLKVPDNIKATPQEYRTTIREMAKGESLTHPMIAEQIKKSKSYVEAKEEAIVKGEAPSLFGEDPKPETVLEDVGEKIGGARKDVWKERGLMITDLENMTASEQSKFVTKDNVLGKPDYVKMAADGTDVGRIALYKIMRDRTAAKPGKDTPEGIRTYVEAMGVLKGVFDDFLSGKIENKSIQSEMMQRVGYDTSKMPKGYNATLTPELKAAREKFWSIYKGRSSPLSISHADVRKIQEMISKGFPSIEPFRRFYDLLALRSNEDGSMVYGLHDHVKGYRRALKDTDGKVMEFATKEDAFAKAKELYAQRIKRGEDMKPPLPVRPHLDFVKRIGDDVRGGKIVGADDFMKQYGFRAVEFGNWAAKDERQKVIDHSYDALNDLARVVNIPDKAVSLNGKLAMAFGARGKSKALAHYEPDYVVINMTKMKGAGSLAHEWGHALDHYFGEMERSNTGKVMPRGASGWESTTTVDRSNMRPEMKEAFANVMGAIFHTDGDKAAVIRQYELLLEQPNIPKMKSDWAKERLTRLRDSDFIGIDAGGKRVDSSNYYKQAAVLDSGSKKDYWKVPTELFARAFEAYIYDKLHANEKRSDYLVQGVGEKLFEEGFKGNPYPAGLERQKINLAFDALFKEMKNETMSDGNVRLYQTKKIADGLKKMMEDC